LARLLSSNSFWMIRSLRSPLTLFSALRRTLRQRGCPHFTRGSDEGKGQLSETYTVSLTWSVSNIQIHAYCTYMTWQLEFIEVSRKISFASRDAINTFYQGCLAKVRGRGGQHPRQEQPAPTI
jgi:hypothetical protein